MQNKYFINTLGGFFVYDPTGKPLPTSHLGAKSIGLLGVLATCGSLPTTRAALQQKLWSDRGDVQGRNSLKQCLRQVRALFADDGNRVVRSCGQSLRLDTQHVAVDILHPRDRLADPYSFLAGVSVKDTRFQLWLSLVRDALAGAEPCHEKPLAGDDARPVRLRLSAPNEHALQRDREPKVETILDYLAEHVAQTDALEIYDCRTGTSRHQAEYDLELCSSAMPREGCNLASLRLRNIHDGKLHWAAAFDPDNPSRLVDLSRALQTSLRRAVDEVQLRRELSRYRHQWVARNDRVSKLRVLAAE